MTQSGSPEPRTAIVPARTGEPAAWSDPAWGTLLDPAVRDLSGFQQCRAAVGVRPPLTHLTGLELTGVAPGVADFQLRVSPWMEGTLGIVHGGPVVLLADAALGTAIHSRVPPRTWRNRCELSVTHVRRVSAGEVLNAHATAITVTEVSGLAAVDIRDDSGGLVAHGASREEVIANVDDVVDPMGLEALVPPPSDAVRPIDRPPVDVEWNVRRGEIDPAEGVRIAAAGRLPFSRIHRFLGVTLVSVDADGVAVSMPITPWTLNVWGRPSRGFVALLGDSGLAAAAATRVPIGSQATMIDMKLMSLAPVTAGTGWLTAHARALHVAGSILMTEAQIVDQAGQVVAFVGGTHLIGPLIA